MATICKCTIVFADSLLCTTFHLGACETIRTSTIAHRRIATLANSTRCIKYSERYGLYIDLHIIDAIR